MKNLGKNERGSITIFVVAAMLFMIIICFTSYTNLFNKMKRQKNDVDNIQKEYGGTDSEKIEQNMEEKYQSIIDKLPEWTQVEEGITNGKVTLKIGDYVNYDHMAGIDMTDTSKTNYTSELTKNGHGDQTFDIEEYSATDGWRVLGIEKGHLLLISSDIIGPNSGGLIDETNGNKFYLAAKAGYENGVKELDAISSKYGQGTFAESARSVRIKDINKITGYNPECIGVKNPTDEQIKIGTKYGNGELWEYGNKVTYFWQGADKPPYYNATNGIASGDLSNMHSSGFYWFNKMNEWKYVEISSTATAENKEKITTLESNYYTYYPETLTNNTSSEEKGISKESNEYNMLFKSSDSQYYWIGSQYVYTHSKYAYFGLRAVGDRNIGNYPLYNSTGNDSGYEKAYGIRPVVSLKSDLQYTSNGNNKWIISQ